MPFRIQAHTEESSVSVIVETVEEALAKLAEFVELGYEAVVKDMMGRIVDAASLAACDQSSARE